MEIYTKETYNSYNEFKKEFINELKQAFIGTKANYNGKNANFADFRFGETNLGECILTTFDVNGEEKTVSITRALESGYVKLEEDAHKAFTEYLEVLIASRANENKYQEEESKIRAEETRRFLEKLAKEKAEKEEIKRQIEADKRYAKRIQRALDKVKYMKPEKTAELFETPTSHYEVVGWMAKHLTSVRASMPDFMESWFTKKFGDVDRYVVDSKKRTVNGNPMQWGLSLKLTFDEEVKGPLEVKATSQNKKTIDNVAFVWDLIENYGFQFGKEQDISKIKLEVPEEYIADFEKGYAM